jgi:hypothetical protein
MNPDDVGNFLSRWSRRKLGKDQPQAEPQPVAAEPPAPAAGSPEPSPEPLPPVESLTPDSDFKPFMRPDVEPGIKQAAMKQLFKDPHFNVMDGLDTYIDDYSVESPIPEGILKTMYQARQHLFSDEEKAAADAADAAADAAREFEAGIPPPIDAEESVQSAEDAVREYEASVLPAAKPGPDPAGKA